MEWDLKVWYPYLHDGGIRSKKEKELELNNNWFIIKKSVSVISLWHFLVAEPNFEKIEGERKSSVFFLH